MRSLPMALVLVAATHAGVVPSGLSAQEPPSPAAATAWSAGSTLAGAGLLVLAAGTDGPEEAMIAGTGGALVIMGPSFGFFYAGEYGRGMASTLLRLGCMAAAGAGVVAAQGGESFTAPLVYLGALVGLGSVVVDVFTADDAARRAAARLEVGATALPGGRPGLGARIRF